LAIQALRVQRIELCSFWVEARRAAIYTSLANYLFLISYIKNQKVRELNPRSCYTHTRSRRARLTSIRLPSI
jgi:hypothetical protein